MKRAILFPKCTKDVWITQGGTVMPIELIEREHVRSIVAYLRRWAPTYKLKVIALQPKQRNKILAMTDDVFLLKFVSAYPALLNRCIDERIYPE